MSAGSSNEAYEIELDADWFEDFPVWINNLTTPDDEVADCEADLWLEPPKGSANQTALHYSTEDGDGILTIVENRIVLRVQKAVINTLSVQSYRLSIRLNHASGYEEPLLAIGANVVAFGSKRS